MRIISGAGKAFVFVAKVAIATAQIILAVAIKALSLIGKLFKKVFLSSNPKPLPFKATNQSINYTLNLNARYSINYFPTASTHPLPDLTNKIINIVQHHKSDVVTNMSIQWDTNKQAKSDILNTIGKDRNIPGSTSYTSKQTTYKNAELLKGFDNEFNPDALVEQFYQSSQTLMQEFLSKTFHVTIPNLHKSLADQSKRLKREAVAKCLELAGIIRRKDEKNSSVNQIENELKEALRKQESFNSEDESIVDLSPWKEIPLMELLVLDKQFFSLSNPNELKCLISAFSTDGTMLSPSGVPFSNADRSKFILRMNLLGRSVII